MTNERAYHYFFSAIETGEQLDVKEQEGHEIYLIAEKAIEKQIPKKPILRLNGDYWCAKCSIGINEYNKYYNNCPMCGQKLDWSVEE